MGNNRLDDKLLIKVSREEEILKVLLNVADSLEALSKQIRESVIPLIAEKIEERETAYFEFHEPLKKNAGFERFLIRVLDEERAKHKEFTYTLMRNEKDEVTRVEVKAPKEHLKYVSNAVEWINKKIMENKTKKEGGKGGDE